MRGMMWLTALGCGILLSSSGCCGFLGSGCCGRGCGYECCSRCEGDYGPTCGPVRRPCRERIYSDDCGGCSTCGPRSSCGECGECGDGCCGCCCQRNFCFHPLRWIGNLFCCGTWCGPSCGHTYWGEAISDPPACNEPCNRNGHWIGHGGCASCNRGGGYQEGEMSPVPEGTPLPVDPPLEPTPAAKAPAKGAQRVPVDTYQR